MELSQLNIMNDELKEKIIALELLIFDFDGVMTNNQVLVSELGTEFVICSRGDGMGIKRLLKTGIKICVISTEVNPVVNKRCEKLKIPCKQNIEDKEKAVLDTCTELNVSPDKTLFLGNDINDIPAFNCVGLPVAVADAYPEVVPHTIFQTKKKGGKGAVREICDIVYNLQN